MKKLILVLSAMTLLSSGAWADLQKGSQTLSVFLGGSGSNSTLDLSGSQQGNEPIGDGGGAVGASYLYYVKSEPLIGVGLDFNASRLSEDHSRNLIFGNDSNTYANSDILMLIGRLAFPSGKLRPYIQGGVGFDTTLIHMTSQPQVGHTWADTGTIETRTLFDDRSTTVAAGWAIGMDWYLTERFLLGLEYRNSYFRAKQSPTAAGTALGLYDVNEGWDISNLFLRIGWTWGASH